MAPEQPAAGDKLNTPSHSLQHRIIASDAGATVESLTVDANDLFTAGAGKCGFTPEGGFFVTLTNKTGGATVKGYVVEASSSTANAFDNSAVGSVDPMGIIYDAGIADGAECRVVVSGIAEVYVTSDGASLHQFVRVTVSADTDDAAGLAIAEAFPSTPFATDKHFQECAHTLAARVGAGLVLCMVHLN